MNVAATPPFDPLFGPSAPERGWTPSPRYLLRRARILAATVALPPGRVLEVGCGPGMLLQEFAERGFECTALETSPASRALGADLARAAGVRIDFHDAPGDWRARFDALFAFEVLEHIEDDRAALAQWRDWLVAGGTLVLSVPAHESAWNAGDVWAGHFRRYERAALLERLGTAGFVVERCECYGFPLANLGERIGARHYARLLRADAGTVDQSAASHRSGSDRSIHVRSSGLLRSLPGRLALRAALATQDLFLRTDLGSGYLVRARVG